MAEHSPTPWQFDGEDALFDRDGELVGDMGLFTDEPLAANAAFIVKAVNNHDEAIGFLELASISLWRAGENAAAREIDKFLDRASPSSRESINAHLSLSDVGGEKL